ncbi:MAG: integrase [Rhodovulum sulfidophilum]|uniref:Integrase n=1 Tax=Rhodovulum sulfidophilum TaxID=35806 RepID=A0A2W5NDN2_RHOSU|nr:MAG: integrase [Rhodovulum sulfidophilum]
MPIDRGQPEPPRPPGGAPRPLPAPGATDDSPSAAPAHMAGSGGLDRLVDAARGYAAQAVAENTRLAYADDWTHFARWCGRRGASPLIADPQVVGLYLADHAAPTDGASALSVATLERRLAGIAAHYRARGIAFDRADRHVSQVLAGIRRAHGAPPRRKAAVSAEELLEMVATLPHDLRGLRDQALLLLGFASGARRSELVGLDVARDDTPDGAGWITIEPAGVLLTLRGKTGWREIEVGRGSADRSCPVLALETWLRFARIEGGPIFRGVSRDGQRALENRLGPKHVERLVKRTVEAAGLRPELTADERRALYAGHSLRAGLASHAEVDEAHVQRHLGHASAEMTRRYQRRRDRFRVNLTKAAGL